MNPPRYTNQLKADALAHLYKLGYPDTPGALSKTARLFSIPDATLFYWAKNPTLPVRRSTRRTSNNLPTTALPIAPTSALSQDLPAPLPPPNFPTEEATLPTIVSANDNNAFADLFRREMSQILAELSHARATASYRDLIGALRSLIEALQKLETPTNNGYEDLNTARQTFHDLLFSLPYTNQEPD